MQNDHPHLETLRSRHRALDEEIEKLSRHPGVDSTEITQKKREKLKLKDEIDRLN